MDVIEEDGLIHGDPTKNRENGIKERFGLITIAMIANHRKKNDQKDKT
jgi:hypothetical protein